MISRSSKRASSPVKKIYVPTIFQDQKLKLGHTKIIEDNTMYFKTQNNHCQFVFFDQQQYFPVTITAVSLKFNQVQILFQSQIFIVSKNLIFQISPDDHQTLFPTNTSSLDIENIFYDITEYQNIQIDTLTAKQYQPENLQKKCTYYDNLAFLLTEKYQKVFSKEEIHSIYNQGVNQQLQQSQYDWFILKEFQQLFVSKFLIVDNLFDYLSSCKYKVVDQQEKIQYRSETVDLNTFVRFQPSYQICRDLMQLLFEYYDLFQNNAIKYIQYKDVNDFLFLLKQKILLLHSEDKIGQYYQLIDDSNLLDQDPSKQFYIFKKIFPGIFKMLFVDLLIQLLQVDVQKAHIMFNIQFQRFVQESNIDMIYFFQDLFQPPKINYIKNELDILVPDNLNIQTKEQFDYSLQSISSSVQEDVRKKNLSLLTFLRQLNFMEFQEDHYNKFPIKIEIEFIQKMINNKDHLITEPSLDNAVGQFTQYLDNIFYMVEIFSFSDFFSFALKHDIDFIKQIQNQVNIQYLNLPSQQESICQFILGDIQLITYEVDIPDYLLLTHKMQSILSMSVDIIIDNFSLDDELQQIAQFYQVGFLKQIQELTTNLDQNTLEISQLIDSNQIQSIELTSIYFIEMYKNIIQNSNYFPQIDFTMLLQVLEFQISVKKAFTYIFEDNLFYYCYNINTGQLDTFFNKFETQCYQIAQSKMLQILLDFSKSLIDNMRIFLKLFIYFETKPLHFHKIFSIQAMFTKDYFKIYYQTVFNWFFDCLQKIVSTFGSHIPSKDQINKAFTYMFELNEIEQSFGNKLLNPEFQDNFQYYKLEEVGVIIQKKVSQYFILLDDIEMDQMDKVFLVVVASHKIGCIVLSKIHTIQQRAFAYIQFLQSMNLAIIQQSSKITYAVQQLLFTDTFHNNDVNLELILNQVVINSPFGQQFEKDFYEEIQKHSNFIICNSNQEHLENIGINDRFIQLMQKDFINNTQDTKLIIYFRKIIFVIKEILQISFIKDQWYLCLSLVQQHNFQNDSACIDTLRYYYKNLISVYNLVQFSFLTSVLVNQQQQIPLRIMKIDFLKQISMLFLSSTQQLRMNWVEFQYFISSQSVQLNNDFKQLIQFISSSQVKNIKYIQMFASICDKNIKPTQVKHLTNLFGITAQQSLTLRGIDIINSYSQYNAKLFDYCLEVNKQLVHTNNIFKQTSKIYQTLQNIEVNFDISEYDICKIKFNDNNLITLLQNSKSIVQSIILQQHLISENMLQFARDVESIIYIMLDLIYGLNILVVLIEDLDLIRSHGNILQFNISLLEVDILKKANKKLGIPQLQNHPNIKTAKESVFNVKKILKDRKEFIDNQKIEAINLLGTQESNTVLDSIKFINQICKKVIKTQTSLLSLVIYFKNNKVEQSKISLKELYKLVIEMYHIRDRVIAQPFKYIFEKIQKQMQQINQSSDIVQQQYKIFNIEENYIFKNQPLEKYYQKMQNFQEYQINLKSLEFNQFSSDALIVPYQDGNYLYYALSYQISPFILFQQFESSVLNILKDKILSSQIFGNVDKFNVVDSPTRGRIILSVQSKNDIFIFSQPLKVPNILYLYELLFQGQYNISLQDQVMLAINQLNQKNFIVFLEKFGYQVQLLSLINLNNFSLLQEIKLFLQKQENKQVQYIGIACRLDDVLKHNIQWLFDFQKEFIQLQPYNLKLGTYWGGASESLEQFSLPIFSYQAIDNILKSFQEKIPVFLYSRAEPISSYTKDRKIILQYISRILSRRLSYIQITDSNFHSSYSAIKRYLIAGNIVILENFQTIQLEYQNKVHDLYIQFSQLLGYFDHIYRAQISKNVIDNCVKNQMRIISSKTTIQDENLFITQDDIILQQLSYKDVQQTLGFIIFSIPQSEYNILQDQHVQSYHYFISKFKSIQQVYAYNKDQSFLQVYEKINDSFAQKFFNLQNIFKYFNEKVQQITSKDFKLITGLLNDSECNLSYSVMFMDLIFKSYIFSENQVKPAKITQSYQFSEYSFRHSKTIQRNIRNKMQSKVKKQYSTSFADDFMLITNLIIQIFNLNKQEVSTLTKMSTNYSNILIKRYYDSKQKKYTYSKYAIDFILPQLNKQASQFLKFACQKFQISIGISLEVFQLMNQLQFKRPILINSSNIYYVLYLGQLIQSLSSNQQAIVYITDIQDFDLYQHNNQVLYIIFPSNYKQFQLFSELLHDLNNGKYINRVFVVYNQVIIDKFSKLYMLRYSCLGDINQIPPVNLYMFANKKNFDIFQLQRFYITNIYQGINTSKINFYRLKHLQNLFKGLTLVLFTYFSTEFNLGNKYEEFLHLRSIYDFFLIRFNIMVLTQEEQQQSQNKSKVESWFQNNVNNKADNTFQSVKGKELVSQIEYVDFGQYGLDEKFIRSVDQITKNQSDDEQLNSYQIQQILSNHQTYGIGNLAGCQMQFTTVFLEQFLQIPSSFDSYMRILEIVFISLWNTFSLFSSFYSQNILLEKKWNSSVKYLTNFDLETYKPGLEKYFLYNYCNLIQHENNLNSQIQLDFQSKYPIQNQVIKVSYTQLLNSIPKNFYYRQFCYINYLNVDDYGQYRWLSYSLGKGVLKNINLFKFINIQKQTQAQQKQQKQINYQIQKQQTFVDGMWDINGLINNSTYQQDENLDPEDQLLEFMKLQNLSYKDNQTTDQQLGFTNKQVQNRFKKQFNTNYINQQQDIQPLFENWQLIFLDEERIAFSTLIACCFMSPSTFIVKGPKYSGKTTLIKIASLIVKDLIDFSSSMIMNLDDTSQYNSIIQGIIQKFELVNIQKQSEFCIASDEVIDIDKDIKDYTSQQYHQLEKYLLQNINEQQLSHAAIDKIYEIITDYQTINENYVIESEVQVQKVTQKLRLLNYTRGVKFPVFSFELNQSGREELSHKLRLLFRDHRIIAQKNLQLGLESQLISTIGQIQLSDCAIVLELDDSQENFFDTIQFQVPNISIQYLRRYFRYYSTTYNINMKDDWIQSFFYGLNLIQSSLPLDIFNNFKFLESFLFTQGNLLPSYTSLVKDSRRYNKTMDLSLEDIIQEIKPEVWTILISNYEKFNDQLEKYQELDFKKILMQFVEMISQQKQSNPTYLQKVIALNQDFIFKSLNIFSLFNILSEQNISNICFQQVIEKFTSLTLLGYLNIQAQNFQDNQTKKFKLFHPWQETQNYVYIYQTFHAVITELCLSAGRKDQGATLSTASFSNKFARKLFYFMRPLIVDHKVFVQKFPFVKVLQKFIKKLPQQEIIVYQIEQFLLNNKMKSLYDAGLISSGIYETNSFFNAHLVQLYSQVSQQYEPMLIIQIYHMLMYILSLKQRNASIIQLQLQLTNGQSQDILEVLNRDSIYNFKQYFVSIINQFLSQKIDKSASNIKQQNSQVSLIEDDDQELEDDIVQQQIDSNSNSEESNSDAEDDNLNHFKGFQNQAITSLRFPIIQIKLNSNSNANQYNMLVQLLSTISQYKVMQADQFKIAFQQMGKTDAQLQDEDIDDDISAYSKGSKASSTRSGSVAHSNYSNVEQTTNFDKLMYTSLSTQQLLFVNNLKHDRKLILDVQNILNMLTTYTHNSNRQHKKAQNQLNSDLVQYIKNFVQELQNLLIIDDDAIEYLVLLQIFRFAILMSLGIKPSLAFNQGNYNKNTMMFNYNMQSFFAGICLQSGLQQFQNTSKLNFGTMSAEFSLPGLQSFIGQRCQQYNLIDENEDQLISDIISGNQFPDNKEQIKNYIQDPQDVILILPKSFLQKKSQSKFSLESTLLSSLQSSSFVQFLFDQQEIVSILKILSIGLDLYVELDNRSFYALLSLTFSIIIIDDLPQTKNDDLGNFQFNKQGIKSFGQIPNILEQSIKSIGSFKQDKHKNIQNISHTQFNIINYKIADLPYLFTISGCIIPDDNQIYEQFQNGYSYIKQQFCFVTVNIYNILLSFCKQNTVNFVEFTQLSSNIVNFYATQIQDFFKNVNYYFLAYHFYEALSSPLQSKPCLVEQFQSTKEIQQDISEISQKFNQGVQTQFYDFHYIKNIQKLLKDDKTKYINQQAKQKNFEQQLLTATHESYILRNSLFTIIENIKPKYFYYQNVAQSSYIDGIFCACYLIFQQSNLVNDKMIFNQLRRSKYSHIFGHCQKIIQKINIVSDINEIDDHYDFLLIFLVSNCQEQGINIDIQENLSELDLITGPIVKFQKIQYSQSEPLIVNGGVSHFRAIQHQIYKIGSFSYPIITLMQQLKIPIQLNDPVYEKLYNIAFLSHKLYKTTFLVEENILMITACLIESIKFTDSQKEEYMRLILQTLDNQELYSKKQMAYDIVKKLLIVDLSASSKEFQQTLARSISISDSIISFTNFSSKATNSNLVILRKFLALRSRKVIQKRQTILIGLQTTITNQALHKYKIVIGCNNVTLQQTLQRANMDTQEFLDMFTTLQNDTSLDVQKQQIFITTQNLVKSVFSNQATIRYQTERYYLLNTLVYESIKEFKSIIKAYFCEHIFGQVNVTDQQQVPMSQLVNQADKNKGVEDCKDSKIDDFEFSQSINSLIADADSILKTSIKTSAYVAQTGSQMDDIQKVLLSIQEVVYNIHYQNSIMLQSYTIQENIILNQLEYPIKAKIQSQKIIQQSGYQQCKQFALAIQFILLLFNNYSVSQLQFSSLLGQDFITNLCANVTQQIDYLLNKSEIINQQYVLQQERQNKKSNNDNKQLINVPQKYPIEFSLSINSTFLVEFFIYTVLPQVLKLSAALQDDKFQLAQYSYINLIFFSFLQEQKIESFDSIKQFIQQYLQTVQLNTLAEQQFCYGQQLRILFCEDSKFKLDQQNIPKISNLKDILPQVTTLSTRLQQQWVKLSSLSYNKIICDSLPWFLKHHSTFVQLSQCQNIFAAVVIYWQKTQSQIISKMLGKLILQKKKSEKQKSQSDLKQKDEITDIIEDEEEEEEEAVQIKDKISLIIDKQMQSERQISNLPLKFLKPSPDTLFAVFLIGNQLQPTLLQDNIYLYIHLMYGILDLQKIITLDQIMQQASPSIYTSSTGLIKNSQLTQQTERQRVLIKFWQDVSTQYSNIMQILQPNTSKEIISQQPIILSDQLFSIAEFFNTVSVEYLKYFQKVKVIMQQDEYDPLKHYQQLSKAGLSPNSVLILFYDINLDINSLISFAYNTSELQVFNNVPLQFTNTLNIQQARDMISIVNVQPNQNLLELQQIIQFFKNKNTVYTYHTQLPIIITIPLTQQQNIQQLDFQCQFTELIQIVNPYIAVIKQPQTLDGWIRYNLSLFMIELFDMQIKKIDFKARYQNNQILNYIILISIIRLDFNIPDSEICKIFRDPLQLNNLLSIHTESICQQYAKLKSKLEDQPNFLKQLLKIFLFPLVTSKVKQMNIFEDDDENDDFEDFDQDQDEVILIEDQDQVQDVDDLSDWGNFSDYEVEEDEEENQEQELIQTGQIREAYFYQNLFEQLTMFETQLDIYRIMDSNQLESQMKQMLNQGQRILLVNQQEKFQQFLLEKQLISNYKLTNCISIFQVLDKYMQLKNQKQHIRLFHNSQFIRRTSFNENQKQDDQIPSLLKSFLSYLQQSNQSGYSIQTPPEIMFQQFIQQSLNQPINSVIGTQVFGIFDSQWIFSINSFKSCFQEIMMFIKFRDAYMRQIYLCDIKLVFMFNKQQGYPSAIGNKLVITEVQEEIKNTIFRDFILQNGFIDPILNAIVHESPEAKKGFIDTLEIYVFSIISKTEIEECDGHILLPLKISNSIVGQVFVKSDFDLEGITITNVE